MQLLVVRHAIAMERSDYQRTSRIEPSIAGDSKADVSDDFRPLTLDGLRKMKKVAPGLATIVSKPHALVSSPLTRAQQTAEVLKEVWPSLDIETCQDLRPNAKFPALVKWLNARACRDEKVSDDTLVVIVGHEPHLSCFISWLMKGTVAGLHTTAIVELKKGGACLLEFPGEILKGKATLKWLALPRMLKALR